MLENVDCLNLQTSHFIVTQHECLWDIIPTPINHRTEEERITKTRGKVKLWKHKASCLDPRCASGPRSQMNPSRMAFSWSLFPSPLHLPSTFVRVIQSYTCDYLKPCDHPTSLQPAPVPQSATSIKPLHFTLPWGTKLHLGAHGNHCHYSSIESICHRPVCKVSRELESFHEIKAAQTKCVDKWTMKQACVKLNVKN